MEFVDVRTPKPIRKLFAAKEWDNLQQAREKSGIPVNLKRVDKDFKGNPFDGIELEYSPENSQQLIDLEEKFWGEVKKIQSDKSATNS